MKLNYLPLFLTICILTGSIGFGSKARSRKPLNSVRVYNGQEVKLGELPWMGAMVYNDGYNPRRIVCSAVLIGPQHLLTAGHCSKKFSWKNIQVVLGEIEVEMDLVNNNVLLEVEFFMTHEEFDWQRSFETPNIGLLKLREPVEFRETVGSIGGIKPIRLAKVNKIKPGDIVEVAGFGASEESRFQLNRGDKIIRTCPPMERNVDKIFVCTVRDYDKVVVDDEDAGGALYTKHTECQGPELLGIYTSDWGQVPKEGEEVFLETYTNVTEFIPWIEIKMKL